MPPSFSLECLLPDSEDSESGVESNERGSHQMSFYGSSGYRVLNGLLIALFYPGEMKNQISITGALKTGLRVSLQDPPRIMVSSHSTEADRVPGFQY